MVLAVLLVTLGAGPPDIHQKQNAVYRRLTRDGVAIGRSGILTLPRPTMEDGLAKAEQLRVMATVPELASNREEFFRRSISSPFALSVYACRVPEEGLRLRDMNLWFISYGSLDNLPIKEVMTDQFFGRKAEGRTLTNAELDAHGIPRETGGRKGTFYVHNDVFLRDRLRLRLTTENAWSSAPDSFVIAGVLDRRFSRDSEFPSDWAKWNREPRGPGLWIGPTAIRSWPSTRRLPGCTIRRERSSWNTTQPSRSPRSGSKARMCCDPSSRSPRSGPSGGFGGI